LIAEHPDDVQLIHGLGESFNNLVMQVTDPKLRVQMHLRSIEYAERAHKLSPQNVEYASDLTGFYTTTAAILALQGRHAEAKELHVRNLDHLGRFIRGNPRIPLIRALVPMTVFQLGRSASRNVEATTYAQLIGDCAKLSTDLPKETPEDHVIDAETQSRAAAWLPTVWRQGAPRALTTAETAELRALRDRGIEALRLAIAAGFKDVARLEQDADLNSLRQDARFTQFVAQLKSAGGAAAAVAQPASERIASDAELAQINQDRASGYQAFGVIETYLNRTEQAAQSLDQALALRQTLAQAAPDNRELAADLAGVRDALAGLYWETGQLFKARELFRERIEQLEQQIDGSSAAPSAGNSAGADPTNVEATRELATLERQFGDSLAGACLWDEAAPHYIQAQKWSLKLKAAERAKLVAGQTDGSAVYEAIVSPMLGLLDGTDSAYAAACDQVLVKYSPASDPEHAARAARLCALKPGAAADLAPVLALTERAQYGWHAYSRALGLYRAGRFVEAIGLIDDARQKQQIVGIGVEDFVLAMAHFQAGRKEQARSILEQANRRSPRNMSSWTYETHNMLDVDWLVLRREANQLIHGSAYGLDDRRRRGQAYTQLKDYEQAQAELAAVIEASPDDPLSRFTQARVWAEQGRTQQATQAVDQARQVLFAKSPGSASEIELWRACAETCRLLERHDDACQAWRQAVAAQSQRVIQQPQLSTGRWLLVQLNEELIKSLQAAGRDADAAAAREELQALHAAFGLPPILRAAVDVLADSGQGSTSSDASLAAIDRLIAAAAKSTAASDPVGLYFRGRLHQRRAEVLQNDGRSESEVNGEFAVAREQFELLRSVDPQNAEAATALADLLLSRSAVTWTTLEPNTLSSRAGTKLTRQADGSILASGPSPDRETYTVVARPPVSTIAAVRLETLPHPSFSRGGAGRDRNGGFFLTEFTVAVAPPGERPAKDPLPIKLTSAVASFHRTMENGNQYPIQNAIDGRPAVWDPWPEVYRRLEAVFAVQPDAARMSDSPLVIQLTSNGSTGTRPTLGHFRLSVTSDAAGFGQEQRRLAARQLSDPWAKLGVAYALSGQAAQGAEALAKGFDRTSDAAAKARLMHVVASDAEVLVEFLKIRPNEPLLLAAMAKLHASRGEHEQAAAARDRARTLFDEHLAKNPDDTSLMHGLADMLLESAGPKWTVLTPMDMQSPGGENLAVEKDGSIFVSGPDPQRALYTLKFQPDLAALTAIRLEALPDQRLPSGGAGRYPGNGNFHLGEMTAAIVPGQPDGQPMRIEIASALASDQGSTQVNASRVIDGDPETYWDTHPRHLQAHWLIAGLRTPAAIDGQELRITLDSGISSWGQHGLGHFRLSASDLPSAYQREEQRLASLKLTDPWAKLGAAYVLAGDTKRAVDLLAKSGEKAGIAAWLESDFSFDEVFDLLEAGHPDLYARYLPTSANAAAERGQTDQARKLYERLVRLQPDNELWKERTDQLQPGVRAVWNFDKGPGSWGAANHCQLAVQDGVLTARTTGSDPNFSSPVSGSEGGKALVLRYRTEREFQMQIFWADSTGGLSEARHLDYPIPESAGQWREISLPFLCQGTLQTLRLDPNTAAAHPVEIDSIVLRHLEPAEFQPLANEFAIKPELARLNGAIDTDPTNPATHYARGSYLTRLGRWRQAAEDFEEEQKLNPVDRLTWFRAGTCLVLAGDEEAFSQHCRAMLVQFKDTTDDQIADSVCKTCLLHPGAVKLSELPAQELRAATANAEHENIRHWFVAGCALISYREGNDDEALAWTSKHPNLTGQSGALALVVRAMAEQRLGRADAARASLAQAETLIPAVLRALGTEAYTGPLPVPSAAVAHDWLAAETLRREAEKLIGPPDKPAGTP
jgi:tetratricopeptide (TPR) repeat protein